MSAKTLRERMKQQREDLMKRRQEQAADKGTSRFGSVFVKEKIPEGRTFWSCKEGQHIIDVVPFVAGPNFPPPSGIREGDIEYVIDLWVHQGVGPTDEQYVCPSWNFRKPCPICEYLSQLKSEGTMLPKEEYTAIRAKNRTVYLVWVHDTPDEERKGLQIWEVASYFFQEKVTEIQKDPQGGGIILFEDPNEGKTISFRRKGKGQGNTEFIGHRFIDRKSPIPNDILDQSFSLDEIIKWQPSYEEIRDTFFAKKSASSQTQSSSPQENVPDDIPFEAPPPVEERQPKEPITEKPQVSESAQMCPGGGTFALDIDKLEGCNTCEIWDDCDQESLRLKKAQASSDTSTPTKKLRRRTNA
jgi:hypothetical protein